MSRGIARVVALLLLSPVLVMTQVANAAAAPSCPGSAADEWSAQSAARACAGRVEIASLRSEYEEVFAEPSGEQTLVASVTPQRAKRADGSWGAIDTTLKRSGDSVAPIGIAADVRFSAGGSGPLVTMVHGGHTMTLSWPQPLPAPVLSGDSATYPEVLPGADLVVKATPSGFMHLLVVKTLAAAANPAVRTARYRIGGDVEVRSTPEGGLTAAAGGTIIAAAEPALMWDTARPSSQRLVAMSGVDTEPRRIAPVSTQIEGRDLVLRPDPALIRADASRLPLVIDPLWNKLQGQWAYATSDNSNGPTTDTKVAAGDPSPGAPALRVGRDPSTPRTYRSFMRFPIDGIAGKRVTGALIRGRVDHTWKCTSPRPNYFYRTAAIGATPRQSWPGPGLEVWLGNNSVYANEDACNDPNMPFEVSTVQLVNDLQAVANAWWSFYYIGISAAENGSGLNENHTERWMRYFLNDFELSVSYNTKPNLPTSPTVDNKPCTTGAARQFVKTGTPTFRAGVSDPDGDSLTALFETARIRPDNSVGGVSLGLTQGSVPSGGTGQATAPVGVIGNDDTFVGSGDWDNDGKNDVLGHDGVDVYLFPGSGTGTITYGARSLIAPGLSGYTIAGMVDWDRNGKQDFIARENANGNLWLYPGNGTRTGHGTRTIIGAGWNEYVFAGLSDYDRDGHQDIIARDLGGYMWLYPGESTTGPSSQARSAIGWGWDPGHYIAFFGSRDYDHDGNPDLLVYDLNGELWLYVGSGTRSPYTGTPYRHLVGWGWLGYQGLLIPDVNGDTHMDILAKQPGTTEWVTYPGSGGHGPNYTPRWTVATAGVQAGGRYAFRANAGDAYEWGGATGWCEFEIDTVAPAVPTVTADIYKTSGCPGGACGSVGQTGRFTFASSSDTQSFLWGFTFPPTNVLNPSTLGGSVDLYWTPPSSGSRTLHVRAIDRAGNESNQTHQFVVAAETTALARWLLNDYPGSPQLADDTGNGVVATITSGTLGVPGRIAPGNDGQSRSATSFAGSGGAATTGPALSDTSRSFSVSAWVKLGDSAVSRTAVRQAGTNNSAFKLEYDKAAHRWRFTAPAADQATTTYPGATSTTQPRLNVWTHLVGTYDSAAREMRLYVNGALEQTATGITAWDGNGSTRIGDGWFGSLAEVQVWNRVISGTEVFNLYDPITNALVARWDMSDVGPGPTYDGSNLVHDLEFYPQPGGPEIPPAGSGHTGTGLSLDGIDDHAITAEPVLYTDQSFTVSAWVYAPTTATGTLAAIAQQGAVESGFYLKLGGDGKWYMVYGDVDGTTGTSASAASIDPAAKGSWVHLVGVYNAQAATVSLYVNGTLQNTSTVWNPWNATGPINVGRVLWRATMRDYWVGSIDEIRIYQGAAADISRIS